RQTHSAFNRGSPHCIARVLPVHLALVLFCKSHRPISERPVTPRVESTKPHSLSEPLALAPWLQSTPPAGRVAELESLDLMRCSLVYLCLFACVSFSFVSCSC